MILLNNHDNMDNMDDVSSSILLLITGTILHIITLMDIPSILKDYMLPGMAFISYTVVILKTLNLLPKFGKDKPESHEKDQ